MRRFRERIQGIPGVTEVAQAECAPLSHDFSASHFMVLGRADMVPIEYNHVTPDYFSLLGIPIVRGRSFTPTETHEAPGIIVTESTARRLWQGQDPLGQTLREISGREYSVIGVAKDAQVAHLGQLDTNYLYFPGGTEDNSRSYVLVRYSTGFTDIATSIRDAGRSIDPGVSIDVTRRLPRSLARTFANRDCAVRSIGRTGPAALLNWRVRDGVLQRKSIRT